MRPRRIAIIIGSTVSVLLLALAAGTFAQQISPMPMNQPMPMRQMSRQQMNQQMNQMMAQMQAQMAQMNSMIKQLRAQLGKIKPELLAPQELAMYEYLKLMQAHLETMPQMMNTMQTMMPMPAPTHRR